MPIADKKQDEEKHAGSTVIAGNFEMSVINGKIVLQALQQETVEPGDVFIAGGAVKGEAGDGLSASAEIIAQAKGDRSIVFKKRRRHNYRAKKAQRQQHTIIRIVAVSDKMSVEGPPPVNAPKAQGLPTASRLTRAGNKEDEAQLRALAEDLEAAAERMGASLNRAIDSVRTALDPERESATRKRFEAEFAGAGGNWLQGLA